jgi:hypothetical protein
MAHDLIFGKNKRNFSRVVASTTTTPVSDEVTLVFSDAEKAMLDKISTARMKAETGDRRSIKTLIDFSKNMAKIKAKAAKGDPKAKRVLLVLRESGLFNKPQTLSMLGLSLFSRKPSDDSHAHDRRVEKFEEEITRLYRPDQISDTAKMIAHNPEYRSMVEAMSKKGVKNAGQILAEAKKVSSGPAVAMRGPSDDKLTQLRTQLRQLRQKDPKTDQDRQAIEILSEKLARVEAMSGSEMGGKAIPHKNYRVAVMKAALKSTGGKRPTTRDYFKAKAAVDRAIGKSGISIYMPGAKPGRRTI